MFSSKQVLVCCTTAMLSTAVEAKTILQILQEQSAEQGYQPTDFELKAAIANQRVYDQLHDEVNGCSDAQTGPTANCSGGKYRVWENVRELVHSARSLCSALDNCGAEQFALRTGLEGLGFALRWTAAEENSAQGDLSNEVVSGQLSSIASRASALRAGASGFSISGVNFQNNDPEWLAKLNAEGLESGGSASADQAPQWSPWGGFINFSYTNGDSDPTNNENAYDFDGGSVNFGFDYRLNNNVVLGTSITYAEERLDFDSSQSIVDGKVEMNAVSVTPFILIQQANFYNLISLGYQDAEFETNRSIRYGTGNPNGKVTNTMAVSKNNASISTFSYTLGNAWNFWNMAFEPSLGLVYRHSEIDAFTETDIRNQGFAFFVDKQSYDSLVSTFGLKLTAVYSFWGAIWVPFVDHQWKREHEDHARTISTRYVEAGNLSNSTSFVLTTDRPEKLYTVTSGGVSFVLRGARQSNIDGPASGGMQGFISLSTVGNIDGYSQSSASVGLRWEF